jgi:hypothetical protein
MNHSFALIDLIKQHKKDLDVVDYLMSHPNINVNECDMSNNTLLILCANRKYTHSVKKLLELGANPNLFNDFGYTPLFWAVTDDQQEMIEILIKYGANVLMEENKGYSIFDLAVLKSKDTICNLLIFNANSLLELEYFHKKTAFIIQRESLRPEGRSFFCFS